MYKHWILFLLFFFVICSAIPAQEKGKVGLNIGVYSYGITWHISERFAIRPDIAFDKSSTDQTSSSIVVGQPDLGSSIGTSKSNSRSIYGGASALIYVYKRDNLSFYISPRYSYTWSSASNSSDTLQTSAVGGTAQTAYVGVNKGPRHNISGSFGTQYSLNKRFSVFGELGLGYNWSTITASSSSTSALYPYMSSASLKAHSLGHRSGLGLILYFN